MKKILMIATIILTTAVTAFSLTRKENKTDVKVENAVAKPGNDNSNRLATAD